MDAYCDEAII